VSFYDEVLRELITALGAALFIGNLVALLRRRSDARRAAARSRPKPPARGKGKPGTSGDLPEAPLARTLLYMLLGLVVMVWGVGSLLAG
jgi:hypothetical protein